MKFLNKTFLMLFSILLVSTAAQAHSAHKNGHASKSALVQTFQGVDILANGFEIDISQPVPSKQDLPVAQGSEPCLTHCCSGLFGLLGSNSGIPLPKAPVRNVALSGSQFIPDAPVKDIFHPPV